MKAMRNEHYDALCSDPQCTHCHPELRHEQTGVSRSTLAGWDQAVVTLNERRKELGYVRTIAVDFDGVIHRYSKGWQDGSIYDPPMPGARDALLALMDHCAVYVHTTRTAHETAGWITSVLRLPTAYEHGDDLSHLLHLDPPAELGGWPRVRFVGGGPVVFWNEQGRLLVSNRKLPAYVYVDDRAYRFTTWEYALGALLPDRGAP